MPMPMEALNTVIAQKLEVRKAHKDMGYDFNFEKDSFATIWLHMVEYGVWSKEVLPEFHAKLNDFYVKLRELEVDAAVLAQLTHDKGLRVDGKLVESPHMTALHLAICMFGSYEVTFQVAGYILMGRFAFPNNVTLAELREGKFKGY